MQESKCCVHVRQPDKHDFNLNGTHLAVTLETSFSTLWKWNSDARSRNGELVPAGLVKLGEELGSQRVDMVLFRGERAIPKDRYDFLALVEFKKGDIRRRQGDRQKLLGVLTYIDTCPYGLVCGWVEDREDYINAQKSEADVDGDLWYQHRVETVDPTHRHYVFCARVIERQSALPPDSA